MHLAPLPILCDLTTGHYELPPKPICAVPKMVVTPILCGRRLSVLEVCHNVH